MNERQKTFTNHVCIRSYIYQSSYRKRMTDIWGEDMSHWWLPNDEGHLATIRTIREFVEYRATKPLDSWAVGIRDMSGIFRTLNIEEQGDASAGTEGSTSPWVNDSSPEHSMS